MLPGTIQGAAQARTGGPRLTVLVTALVLTLALPHHGQAEQVAVPALNAYVTDLTGTLAPEVRASLNDRLAAFDRETSTQIVVVIIPTVGDEAIEEVGLRIAEENRIGRKGKDNGALLLVARSDRKLRIEVGYGLEGVLTDALSSQIIRKEIVPHFRNNDYAAGIVAGVEAIMSATRNEYTADPEADSKGGPGISSIIVLLIIVFFLTRLRSSGLRRSGFPPFPPMGGGWGSGSGGFGGGGFSSGSFGGGGGSFGGGGSSGSW